MDGQDRTINLTGPLPGGPEPVAEAAGAGSDMRRLENFPIFYSRPAAVLMERNVTPLVLVQSFFTTGDVE